MTINACGTCDEPGPEGGPENCPIHRTGKGIEL